jgi:phosphoribosylformylglycinamidine synthase
MLAALASVSGHQPITLWHADSDIPPVDLIVLPGGFSYGDYLRCGAIAAHSPIMRTVASRAAAGVPILGVCNGFQILCEAKLLPGALIRNASLRFACRDVQLRVETTESVFTSGYRRGQIVRFPIAHGEGNYRCNRETLSRLRGEGRVAFRYVPAEASAEEPDNPNGAIDSIAGILNERRNVLGLMPHPENMIEPAQGGTDGRRLFESLASRVGVTA